MNYENYRKRREFEDSLKMLKESCMFEQEESTEGNLPLDVTGGNEDVDKASNADDTTFIEDETEENQYIKDIRKLAFKGMVAEEEAVPLITLHISRVRNPPSTIRTFWTLVLFFLEASFIFRPYS